LAFQALLERGEPHPLPFTAVRCRSLLADPRPSWQIVEQWVNSDTEQRGANPSRRAARPAGALHYNIRAWAGASRVLLRPRAIRHADTMPDRPFPAVDALIRRVQRAAAQRPDPLYIIAQTISMAPTVGVDPYALLGVLVEGAVQTLVQHIPSQRQDEAAATLTELLAERLKTHGLTGDDR
jgi:hypothetical protein